MSSHGGANRWATVCSLITPAKLNEVEPFAYLKDVLQRISNGYPVSRLGELLPWNWPPTVLNYFDVSEMNAYALVRDRSSYKNGHINTEAASLNWRADP